MSSKIKQFAMRAARQLSKGTLGFRNKLSTGGRPKNTSKQKGKKKYSRKKDEPKNSLGFAPSAVGSIIRSKRKKFHITPIHNVEVFGDINCTAAGYNTLYGLPLNPANSALFPWLCSQAALFEKFRWKYIKINFYPSCSTTEAGRLVMYIDTDPQDLAAQNYVTAMQNEDAVSATPWQEFSVRFDKKSQSQPWYFCTPSKSVIGGGSANDRLNDPGQLFIQCDGITTGKVLGSVEVEYGVEFCVPIATRASVLTATFGAASRTTNVSQYYDLDVVATYSAGISVSNTSPGGTIGSPSAIDRPGTTHGINIQTGQTLQGTFSELFTFGSAFTGTLLVVAMTADPANNNIATTTLATVPLVAQTTFQLSNVLFSVTGAASLTKVMICYVLSVITTFATPTVTVTNGALGYAINSGVPLGVHVAEGVQSEQSATAYVLPSGYEQLCDDWKEYEGTILVVPNQNHTIQTLEQRINHLEKLLNAKDDGLSEFSDIHTITSTTSSSGKNEARYPVNRTSFVSTPDQALYSTMTRGVLSTIR